MYTTREHLLNDRIDWGTAWCKQAEKLCGSVELGLSPDAPLLVKYDLETADKGHMQFYLAPKIDE